MPACLTNCFSESRILVEEAKYVVFDVKMHINVIGKIVIKPENRTAFTSFVFYFHCYIICNLDELTTCFVV